ncbi:MAG: hypothetical protein D6785_10880 [Planctomycetota bacterium]|nr:MAG: hypothetical protein D6785_10880 [Planctomycetota bacterium]
MWPFNKLSEQSIKKFYEAGGRPTWKEWCSWTEEQKKEAIETMEKIKTLEILFLRFALAPTISEKLAVAEEMAEFDGGELAREVRRQINLLNLAKNEHPTTIKTN